MALPTFSKSVGTVFTIAARTHLKTIPIDQFFTKCPAYVELRKNKESKDGGETLVVPVVNGAEPIGDFYNKADSLTMQDSDVLTEANYNWSFAYEPVVIFDQDMWKARGKEELLLDIVKEKTNVAVMKLKRKIYQGIYAAAPAAKNLQGLPVAIATGPSSSGLYGNLDGGAASQPFWRNYDLSSGSFGSNGVTNLTTMFRTLTDQSDAGKPTAAFTDPTTWGYIHNEVVGHFETHAMVDSKSAQYADLGFQVISFMGTPIVSDPYCTSGVIYAVNSEAVQLVEMADAAFVLHPAGFVSGLANGQAAMVSAVVWNGQMATYERRALGKLYSITA